MAEITINDVKYTNVPNKKAGTKFASALTQSNIGVSQSVADYMNSAYFYTLVNAVDINWNGIEVAANSYINTTSDLIKFILSVSNNVDLSDYATMSYVNEKISDVIGAAPETLDTLEELAYALSYNASLSYIQEALSGKANVGDVYTKNEVDTAIQNISLTPGPAGQDGQDGAAGADGKSAYELAVDEGYEGTLSQWLESLHGQDGNDGVAGADGNDGQDGLSAYQIAVNNGFEGDETAWLASLKGDTGEVDYSRLNSYVSYTAANSYYAAKSHNHYSQFNIYKLISSNVGSGVAYLNASGYTNKTDNVVKYYHSSDGIYGSSNYLFILSQIGPNIKIGGTNAIIGGDLFTSNTTTYVDNGIAIGKCINSYYVNIYNHKCGVNYSLSIGQNLKVFNDYQVTFGQFNSYIYTNYTNYFTFNTNTTLLAVGNGESESARHNAFEVRRNGKVYIADTFSGTPYILQDKLVHKSNIDDLKNVTITNIQNNQILTYNGTNWINSNIPTPDLSNYVSYTQANSYYAAKNDIPTMPDMSSYVSITSYNALAARVEELASWIASYHSSYTPTPSGSDPDIYFMNPTMTVDYTMSASMVDGGAMAYPQYLSGSNSTDGAWITWSSSDTAVATVAHGGCITAQGNGTTNISAEYTAHDTYNYKKVEYSLTITNYNSSIEPVDNSFYFMDSNRTLYNSGMDSLSIINNTGIDTMTYPIQWTSSNANITVNQYGVVSWTMTGETATITATLSDGTNTHTATCTVTTAVNKTSATGNWYENGNSVYQLVLVEGTIDAHTLTFTGNPSDSWTFSGTLPSGISVDSSTGEITVSALSSATVGDYYITGNRMEDSTYWSGMVSFTIKVLPSGSNPQFYYEQQSVNLDNSAMQTQSPMLHNEYAGMEYDVTYSSADTSVATVDAYGMISFAGAGNTTVTATLGNGGNTIATATITVYCTVYKQSSHATWIDPSTQMTSTMITCANGTTIDFNGTPLSGWTFTPSDPAIIINAGNQVVVDGGTSGQTYTVSASYTEDATYYAGSGTLTITIS